MTLAVIQPLGVTVDGNVLYIADRETLRAWDGSQSLRAITVYRETTGEPTRTFNTLSGVLSLQGMLYLTDAGVSVFIGPLLAINCNQLQRYSNGFHNVGVWTTKLFMTTSTPCWHVTGVVVAFMITLCQ